MAREFFEKCPQENFEGRLFRNDYFKKPRCWEPVLGTIQPQTFEPRLVRTLYTHYSNTRMTKYSHSKYSASIEKNGKQKLVVEKLREEK